MGVLNVTPDSFSDGGRFARSECRGGPRPRPVRGGGGHRRRGRRVDAPREPLPWRPTRSAAGWRPWSRDLAASGARTALRRHHEGRRRARRPRRRRRPRERRQRLPLRSRTWRPWSRSARCPAVAHAPARRVRRPCTSARLRRRDGGGEGRARATALALGESAGISRARCCSSTRASASPRTPAHSLEVLPAPARASRPRPPGARGALAQELPRQGAGPPRGRAALRHRGRRGGQRPRGRPPGARSRRARRWCRWSGSATPSWAGTAMILERFFAFFTAPEFSWLDALDILIVAFIIYELLQFIRGTHAVQMAIGALVLVVLYWTSLLAQPRDRQLDAPDLPPHRGLRDHRGLPGRDPEGPGPSGQDAPSSGPSPASARTR